MDNKKHSLMVLCKVRQTNQAIRTGQEQPKLRIQSIFYFLFLLHPEFLYFHVSLEWEWRGFE